VKRIDSWLFALAEKTGLIGPAIGDTYVAAHEVGEWANDPFGNDRTPAWRHVGQVGGCQYNLEVGDPLTGTAPISIAGSNGFTYRLQEPAFFSWFCGLLLLLDGSRTPEPS